VRSRAHLVLADAERVERSRERVCGFILQLDLLLQVVHRLLDPLDAHRLVEALELILAVGDRVECHLRDVDLLERVPLLLQRHLGRADLFELRIEELFALEAG
jgi:hypothetical protein